MINFILKGVLALIIGLVNIVLAPIDLVITQFLPDLSTGVSAIGRLFELVGSSLGFCVSLTGLSSECLSLIVLFFTFKLTVPLMVSTVKSAIKWYKALKP